MMSTWLSYRDLTDADREVALHARRRPHRGLRRVGQPRRLVGQQRGRAPGLPAAGQLGSLPREGRSTAARRADRSERASTRAARSPPRARSETERHGAARRNSWSMRACGTGESPVWSAAEEALYWVDIPGRALHRWSAGGHAHLDRRRRCWPASRRGPTCRARGSQAWKAACSRIAATGRRQRSPRRSSRRWRTPCPGMRFNDGRCDRQGRFWAGTMLMDMAAGSRAGAPLSLRQGRRSARRAARRPDRAQRPGLQPGRPHDVPVGLAPERADRSGPSTTTPPAARPRTAASSST